MVDKSTRPSGSREALIERIFRLSPPPPSVYKEMLRKFGKLHRRELVKVEEDLIYMANVAHTSIMRSFKNMQEFRAALWDLAIDAAELEERLETEGTGC